MRIPLTAAAAVAFTFVTITATPTDANTLANMHTIKPVGGKMCMVDHPHHRESGAFRSKAQAKARVIRAWENYTRFEYGSAWASYRLAIKKNLKCTTSSGGQTSCTLVAYPCRR